MGGASDGAGQSWADECSRRAFLARSGALAAVATLGPLASVAEATGTGSALTAAQVGVITGLASAVQAAAGSAAAVATGPAQASAAVQSVYANLSATVQAEIARILDAIDAAPGGTPFSALDGRLQSSFLQSVFSAVLPAGLADTAFVTENQLLYEGYVAAVELGALPAELGLGEAPGVPGDGQLPLAGSPLPATAISAAQSLEATVFAGLALIEHPPPSGSTLAQVTTAATGLVSALGVTLTGTLGTLGIQNDTLNAAVVSIDAPPSPPALPALSYPLLNAIERWSG